MMLMLPEFTSALREPIALEIEVWRSYSSIKAKGKQFTSKNSLFILNRHL
jgi:hypothetical protein